MNYVVVVAWTNIVAGLYRYSRVKYGVGTLFRLIAVGGAVIGVTCVGSI